MVSCYICGDEIGKDDKHYRRRVLVSESEPNFWVKLRTHNFFDKRMHYGMRSVCARCVAKQAKRQRAQDRLTWVVGGIFVLFFSVLWILQYAWGHH